MRRTKLGMLAGNAASVSLIVVTTGCGTINRPSLDTPASNLRASAARTLGCDDSLKTVFQTDPRTSVRLIKAFRKGDDINLNGRPSGKIAANDLCLIKLNVGPGNPGPAGAPSTSQGIGIEVWLPSYSNWNKRMQVLGGGGFAGDAGVSSLEQVVGISTGAMSPYDIAGRSGSVSAVTDTGHVGSPVDGSFSLNPDGSINQALWGDFASRGLHETVVKTKVLAKAYYGESVDYSYFDGCSTGGRQGHMAAQLYPDDFDGILVGNPAINWTKFITAELYPQIAMLRDLGKPLSPQQLSLVSSAAVSACDTDLTGQHLGYITNPGQCRYDPTKDRAVLCRSDGGENDSAACVTSKEARVVNKIWYGQTSDGRVPDPAVSNGYSAKLDPGQLWFGLARGSVLTGLAGSEKGSPLPFPIAAHQVAINLQDPALATPTFQNAKGKGEDRWQSLGYADLARAYSSGVALQSALANINTDNPDLRSFRARKGKMLLYHGMADPLIPIQGSMHYYEAVAGRMGGFSRIRSFYRFFTVPGLGHCSGAGAPGIAGVSPLPDPPRIDRRIMFDALVAWVERGKAPDALTLSSAGGTVSPLCSYPMKLTYTGGDKAQANSYRCV